MEAQYTDTCTLWGKETAPFLFSPITCQSTFYVHNFWHSDTWMNFPSAAYFTYFVDSGTDNQLNILFVYMVADDNINYLRECIMLYNKRDRILIHNLHVLKRYGVKKLVKSFHKKEWRLCSLNYLIKKTRETSTTDQQPGSGRPHTSHTAENIDAVNDLVLSKKSVPETHKTTCQIARETGVLWRSVGRITKTFCALLMYC